MFNFSELKSKTPIYNWDDILIVGDSFCSHRETKDSWPQIVTCALAGTKFDITKQPRGKGFAGGAWWSYRKVLMQEFAISPPKVLIICHTEPYRIPNDKDYSLNYKTIEHRILTVDNVDHPMPIEVAEAAMAYYKELYSCEFHTWAVYKWFSELDELCKLHNVEKVIHLYCFDGEYTSYTFTQGTTVATPAMFTYAEKSERVFFRFKNKVINHFTVKGNRLFANSIIDLVNNYQGNVRIHKKLVEYGIS